MGITWVLESDVFPESGERLACAIEDARHECIEWDDAWWDTTRWPSLEGKGAVFHGCLANAARVQAELPWQPGSFCPAESFRCSAWYPTAVRWLVHEQWRVLTVRQLCAKPDETTEGLAARGSVFVRPDSALKPFSGRLVRVGEIDPEALDHGFYYDDLDLPVVVAAPRSVGREWRFVVASGDVIAGSAYEPDGRHAVTEVGHGAPWEYASSIAADLPAPATVYMLDVCEVDGDLRLLEINPFGGADLYACDAQAVVRAVSAIADREAPPPLDDGRRTEG